VADLIAAGEVVERPASAVKELTENAIDAGATTVTVEIQRGGMSYLRVTDNGCGIASEDCLTAFLRHATSKIRTEYDLEAIGTLGFRGEALAAIAAVARVELMTRTEDSDVGTALLLDGGVVRRQEEVGCPKGTTLIVRDLFFNTPARQKFLKRDSAEGSAVFAVVQHAALSHPEVSFRFLREGKEELHTPGDGSLQSAVYAVLGRDLALGLLPCKAGGDEIAVEGFVSRPVCCRGSRGSQFFFVNGRYVKSRTMQAALEQAYANQKMVGRFPGCVLHLTTRLNGVDVNVHPTKTEVKFTSEKKLFDAVYYAVLSALEGAFGAPEVQLSHASQPSAAPAKKPAPQKHDSVSPNQTFFRTETAAHFRGELHSDAKPVYSTDAPRRTLAEEPLGAGAPEEAQKETAARHVERFVPKHRPETPLKRPEPLPGEWTSTPSTVTAPTAKPESKAQASQPEAVTAQPVVEKPQPTAAEQPPVAQVSATVERASEEARKPDAPKMETMPDPISTAAETPEETPDTPAWRLVGEVLNTYAIVERGDEVWLIDKHAAHERMNFDRLKAMHHKPMSQLLLQPLVLRLEPEETQVLLEQRPLLEEFAFAVEDFGGGSLIVRQAPDYLPLEQIESALGELAGRLLTCGTADPESARDEVLHTMACKAAIKGGWKNGEEELRKVCQAVMDDQVRYCPHGRPVAIKMTRKDLEKQFKRA
jgi:DNA mismatch repair protein MutL